MVRKERSRSRAHLSRPSIHRGQAHGRRRPFAPIGQYSVECRPPHAAGETPSPGHVPADSAPSPPVVPPRSCPASRTPPSQRSTAQSRSISPARTAPRSHFLTRILRKHDLTPTMGESIPDPAHSRKRLHAGQNCGNMMAVRVALYCLQNERRTVRVSRPPDSEIQHV